MDPKVINKAVDRYSYLLNSYDSPILSNFYSITESNVNPTPESPNLDHLLQEADTISTLTDTLVKMNSGMSNMYQEI